MSNQFLKLRRSAVPGRVPSTSSIDFGEIALNTFDGLAFIKRSGSNGEEVITLGSREGAFTGSFSGSFIGNGGGLFNISASAIVGLNLSQIATGSVSASVGVGASSFSVVSGSNTFLYISSSGNVGLGLVPVSSLASWRSFEIARGSQLLVNSNGSDWHLSNNAYFNSGWKRGVANLATDYNQFAGNHSWLYAINGVVDSAITWVETMRLTNVGNLMLQNGGTFTDSGERLQVSGSSRFVGNMVITGSGNTSATNALIVNNSSNSSLLTVRNDGLTTFGGNINFLNQNLRLLPDTRGGSITSGYLTLQIGGTNRTFTIYNNVNDVLTVGSEIGNNIFNVPTFQFIVGATSPNVSAQVQIDSTTRGFLTPRMTAAQRLAITTPAQGLIVYDTGSATEGLWLYNSGSTPGWQQVLTNSGSQSISGSITVNNVTVTGTLTAQTIVAQTITSSTEYVSGSTIFGNSLSNTHQFTGSVSITGSLRVNGGTVPLGSGVAGQVVVWSGSSSISGSNGLFWDATNSRLGIGTDTPTQKLEINGNVLVNQGGNGFYTSQKNNHFTQNAYYDGSLWRSYGTSASFGSAILFQTNGQNSKALGIYVDNSISAANESLAFSALLELTTGGNLLLGNTTDNGQRLQVYGTTFLSGSVTGSDMLIRGSGNTSGTNALIVQNSSTTNIIAVKNNRTTNIISDAGQLNIASSADATNGIIEADVNSSNTQTVFVQLTRGTVGFASTAINQTAVRINGGFAPTSGTATWNSLHINPTINQTGGANGITRGLYIQPSLTANADFRAIEWSNSVSGSTSWGLYGTGNALNYISGRVGIGASLPSNSTYLSVTGQITGGVISYGVFQSGFVRSDVTIYGIGIANRLNKSDSNTLPDYYNFAALGGGSISGAVTNEYGFVVGSGMTSATSSYGFYGDLASGTSRWNLYMNGTANNYLAGALGIGVTSPTTTLDILGNFKVTPVLGSLLQIGSSPNTSSFQEGGAILVDDRTVTIGSWDNSRFNVGTKYNHVNNSEALDSIEFIVGATTTTNGRAMFISSSGNIGIGTITPITTLDVSGSSRFIGDMTITGSTTLRNASGTGSIVLAPSADSTLTLSGFYSSGQTNIQLTSGGSDSYINAFGAGNRLIIRNNSGITFTAYSSATQYMHAGSSGVIIGGTSTTPVARLDVRGNAFVSGTLDILDAEINYQRNNNVTTGSARLIASIPTASYNAAFFDYVIVSGSNARAGTVMSVWASSSVEWNETYTNDIGSTTDVSLYAAITGSSIGLFATSSINNIWTIKSLIRTI